MFKKNELSPDNSSNTNQMASNKREIQTKKTPKTNKNIINKIHSIKASINNNNNNLNKLHFIKRKNNFKRIKEPSPKKNISRSKSHNRKTSNSLNKFSQKNKIKNEDKIKSKKDNFNNVNLNQNISLKETNLENNNILIKNSSNSNLNNNNIIITINNYNKITPTKIVETTNINEKNAEIIKLNVKKNKKVKDKELQNIKKYDDKKLYNYFMNRHNYSSDNDKKNIYNNNIFYNQLILSKNDNNIINMIDDNNIDNLSINTSNTINKSNNLVNSNNNTTNGEYTNKILVKKTNKYQDNIILKKKQLEMYSPLSYLKKNLEIDKKSLNGIKFKEKNSNYGLSPFNNIKVDSQLNSTSELNIKDKNEEKDNNQNKDLTDLIIDKIEQNIKNKNQVSNILSTLNRIKNTKQLYKNNKIFGYTKINRKKKSSLNKNNNSFLKTHPYKFFDKRKNSFNERKYYSRTNSKNALRDNFKMNYKNFYKNRTVKSSKKIIDRTFMSENRNSISKKKRQDLFLSNNDNKNKKLNSKNRKITNKSKSKRKNSESKTIDIDSNYIRNSPVLLAIKKAPFNDLDKNIIKDPLSISSFIDTSLNNNKLIDNYETATIANIEQHCNSLLSKINKKIKINEEIKNEKIYKKIFANASLCRKGLNRLEEEPKINQDALFKVKFGDLNYSYYGVCDGHGPLGHLVSDFIKSNLTFIVYKNLKSLLVEKSKSSDIDNSNNNNINLKDVDDSSIDFPKLFTDSFILMESKLTQNKYIDIELSGTTCISLLFCSDRIISSNIGDSRAIKGIYNSELNKWEYIPLSRDHKPTEIDEAERIKNSKGIIHPYIDDDNKYIGPDRVWNEEEELPGLAMSRSFGDELAKKVGVCCEPEVKIFPYNKDDKFIVIASDGLWEYVNNEEVVEIVGKFQEKNDCDGAVSELYELSRERWIKFDDYIDDISIIVVFISDI